jgi:hypothetical protein
MGKLAIFAIYLSIATFVFPSTGHAYLDPGTGSIILQAIVGSIAAAGAVLGVYWQKVKGLFGKGRAPADDAGEKDAS